MLNQDSFIKFMHMAASVRDPCRIQITPQQGSHSVISKKSRLFMKKKFIYQKKQKCKKTYECKYNGD